MEYDKFYKSSAYYGSDKIIKSYLKLNLKKKLPIVIPHGIDFYQHEKYILDWNCVEPTYLCLRDDIYKKIKLTNRDAIKFPHPWLFLLKQKKIKKGKGTLFITPPCSPEQYMEFYNKIDLTNFNKPWISLIKHRGAKKSHFTWWKKKGFKTVTAGNMKNKLFYHNLFRIINSAEEVTLCNMSSAGIFSAAMGKKITFIKDFKLSDLETMDVEFPKPRSNNYLKVHKVWRNIFFSKKHISKKTALSLLGSKYFKSKNLLKKEILKSFYLSKKKPLFLETSNSFIYLVMIYLLKLNDKIIKFFPNPIQKIVKKFMNFFRLSCLKYNTINDFGYYKIGGKFEKPTSQNVYLFKLDKPEPGHVPKFKKKN